MKEIFNFFEFLVLVKVFAYHGIFGNRKGSAGDALKVKVQLTYCVNNNAILYVFLFFWGLLWPWKLTSSEHWMNVFFVFVSLMTCLGYIFSLDVSFFTKIDYEKGENQLMKYLWMIYFTLRKNFWKFMNTIDSQ